MSINEMARSVIRKEIKSSGIKMISLAEKTMIDRGQLSRFINGSSGISSEKLMLILNELEIKVDIKKDPKKEHMQMLRDLSALKKSFCNQIDNVIRKAISESSDLD